MMLVDNKFEIGQTVYLKTDSEQYPRIVTRLSVTANGITYSISSGVIESWHYDFEISEEKDVLINLQLKTNE